MLANTENQVNLYKIYPTFVYLKTIIYICSNIIPPKEVIFSFLIATFVMSDILFVFFVGSTKIGEISDISKCFENFVSQTLGVLTRIYAAELRI